MTALTWDNIGDRVYETGLDRGVLFFPEGGGVAWNGLRSVQEKVSTTVTPLHFDGVKYNDIVTVGDFSATLRAITYPEEFLRFEGVLEDQSGVLITGQSLETFGLCYRTKIGSDLDANAGYKIHILYNLTAIPSEREYGTLTLDPEPIEFEWQLTAIPESIEKFKPTAHIIIDTRKVDPLLVKDLESILYGDADSDPRLPSLKGLSSFIRKWDRLIITDHGDGTWSATANIEGVIAMLGPDTFAVTSDTAIYLDDDTYEISSTEKNEEDL